MPQTNTAPMKKDNVKLLYLIAQSGTDAENLMCLSTTFIWNESSHTARGFWSTTKIFPIFISHLLSLPFPCNDVSNGIILESFCFKEIKDQFL